MGLQGEGLAAGYHGNRVCWQQAKQITSKLLEVHFSDVLERPAGGAVMSLLLIGQYCNGVDWRQKLDSQRGAVLATELKNNSYKLARWTCCAMLAGSEYLKLG